MENLRDLRVRQGYTLEWMARQCEVDMRRLSDYERGQRRWPPSLLQKTRELLGLQPIQTAVPRLSWSDHRKMVGPNWNVQVDAGTTWATVPLHYEDLYRQLNPQRTPDLAFRSTVRVDSSQEPLGWVQLFEDGAEAVAACPGQLDFPFHPLVDSQGYPLGSQYRAAFRGTIGPYRWILFPQITLFLREKLYRPDALLLRYGPDRRSALVQLDGGAHQNKKWDDRQDAQVRVPTLRFPSRTILGLNFAAAFREELLKL